MLDVKLGSVVYHSKAQDGMTQYIVEYNNLQLLRNKLKYPQCTGWLMALGYVF